MPKDIMPNPLTPNPQYRIGMNADFLNAKSRMGLTAEISNAEFANIEWDWMPNFQMPKGTEIFNAELEWCPNVTECKIFEYRTRLNAEIPNTELDWMPNGPEEKNMSLTSVSFKAWQGKSVIRIAWIKYIRRFFKEHKLCIGRRQDSRNQIFTEKKGHKYCTLVNLLYDTIITWDPQPWRMASDWIK